MQHRTLGILRPRPRHRGARRWAVAAPWTLALALALVGLCATTAVAAKRGQGSPVLSDPLAWRGVTAREPYGTLAATGRPAAADSLALAALADAAARREPDSLLVARLLNDRVECAVAANRFREPLVWEQAIRAFAIHRREPGPDSLLFARSLIAIGDLQRRRSQFDSSYVSLRFVLGIRERHLPADDPEIATALVSLAANDLVLGRTGARPLLERALPIRLAHYGPDNPRTIQVRYNIGAAKLIEGDVPGAYADVAAALADFERVFPPLHPDVIRSRNGLAVISMELGDLPGARRLEEDQLAALDAAPRRDSVAILRELGVLTDLCGELGDGEGGMPYAERLMAMAYRMYARNTLEYARAQYMAAKVYYQGGRAAEAAAMLDSSLTTNIGSASADSSARNSIAYHLALATRAAGDYERALPLAEQAQRDYAGARYGNPFAATSQALLGQVYADLGRHAEATPHLERGLALSELRNGRGHAITVGILEALAENRAALGDPAAPAAALEVARSREANLRASARGFSEREALLVVRRQGLGLEAVSSLAARGRLSSAERWEALGAVAAARGLVLDEMAARNRLARAAGDPAVAAELDSLQTARATLARAMMLDPGRSGAEGRESMVAAARATAERLERQLAGRIGGAASGAATALDSARVATALAGDGALVSYVAFSEPGPRGTRRPRLMAWVVTPGRAPEAVDLGDLARADSLSAAWWSEVARGSAAGGPAASEAAARRVGTELRRQVWDPLVKRLGAAARVFVVPDGMLQLVDLAALPSGNGYLVEQHARIARLSSERDLVPDPAHAPGRGLFALGDPAFEDGGALVAAGPGTFRGAPAACADFAAVRFEPLRASGAEVEEVASLWRRVAGDSVMLLEGAAADEASFKRLAGGHRALHLATHGFVLGDACGVAAPGGRGIGGVAPARAVPAAPAAAPRAPRPFDSLIGRDRPSGNPLRLAGLALAGANRRGDAPAGAEDGILTSEEIAALDLRGVEDAVLSACETGGGGVMVGEGVFGLQRAFRIAGADVLVMSLWPVEDGAAGEWMREYWRTRLERRSEPALAARDASRARLEALRRAGRPAHPAAWACFVASGAGAR